VAERLHIATRHFQKIESGELNITLRTLCKVADLLQVAPAELLKHS
jgi:transcriptional regulator with XRE-family HTH domain